MKRKFTLIELIIVIAIISILAAIVIPNVSEMNGKAYTSKVTGNIRNIQTVVDMYALDNNGQYPTLKQPILEEPQLVNFDILYPKYLKSIKKVDNENYWVDYSGKVWGSTVDAPTDIFVSEENIEWGNKNETSAFHVYEIRNTNSQGATYNKKLSLRHKVLTHKNIDKFKMNNEGKDYLVSAVDNYGLETAPVGPNYSGIGSDWFTPIFNKEGSFDFMINSEELMYWDSFSTVEYKPEGTNIKYEFSIMDEYGNYLPFVEDFYSLAPSKSLKIKVIMTGFNGKMPSLYDMKVFYHFSQEEENYKEATRIYDTPTKVIDEYVLQEGETIDEVTITDSYITDAKPNKISFGGTGGTTNYSIPNIYNKDFQAKTSYEYSTDSIKYNPVNSLVDIPSGSHVRIIRESSSNNVDFNTPIIKVNNKPIVIQDAKIPFTPINGEENPIPTPPVEGEKDTHIPSDSEIEDTTWETVQEFALVASSGDGEIAHWISVIAEDVQPEHTRILYRYATSNGFGWNSFVNNVSELSDSRMIKVYSILQVEKDYVGKVEDPEIINIIINSSKGVKNLNTINPTGIIELEKDNNIGREDISTASNITWDYEKYDPQGKKIVEVVWGGDKRNNYNTPGIYTVTLKLRNELNYWSDEIIFTFDVKDEKPVAVITPADIDIFEIGTPVVWNNTSSYDPDGDKIFKAEWGGDYNKEGIYTLGSYTVSLRVQDEEGNWSDLTNKTFEVKDNSGLKQVVAGNYHTVALKDDGTILAWGSNGNGQLGLEKTIRYQYTPAQVTGINDVKQIAADGSYTVALKNDGTVWVWGSNVNKFLGIGDIAIDQFAPVQVTGISNVIKISSKGDHTLALKDDGTVWAWGSNSYGQLGIGNTTTQIVPVQVTGINDVKEIEAGGTHTIAIKNDGTVWVWGKGGYGQLGIGDGNNQLTPVQNTNISDIKQVSAGDDNTIAVKNDGTVWAWGKGSYGQLGTGNQNHQLTPVQVLNISDVKQVSSRYNRVVAVKNDGTLWTWGYNNFGQLGTGDITNKLTPVQVPNINDVQQVSAGLNHTVVIKNDESMWAWGSNSDGRLGTGDTTIQKSPVLVDLSN